LKKLILFAVPLLCITGCGTSQAILPSDSNTIDIENEAPVSSSLLTSKETATAAELFKICMPCHGNKAQLHALGVSEVIATWNPNEIKQALLSYKNGTRDITGNGYIMRGEAMLINQTDIELLSKYIPTLAKTDK